MHHVMPPPSPATRMAYPTGRAVRRENGPLSRPWGCGVLQIVLSHGMPPRSAAEGAYPCKPLDPAGARRDPDVVVGHRRQADLPASTDHAAGRWAEYRTADVPPGRLHAAARGCAGP